MSEYLTTKELAELLRIKERKVYALAASGEIPCSRAMGKLLFPRQAIDLWLSEGKTGSSSTPASERPNVILGSHDPLLEWALRESICGIATFLDGSLDGIDRFSKREGIATGLHILDGSANEWNIKLVEEQFRGKNVVMIEWATRERGLILNDMNKNKFKSLSDLRGFTVVPRQAEAGSQTLFKSLMAEAGIKDNDIEFISPARTETDAVLAVSEGKADAAFGLKALANQYKLAFVPLITERFDILVDRKSWFEPAWQKFMKFCRTDAFQDKVKDAHGYNFSAFGEVHFNG